MQLSHDEFDNFLVTTLIKDPVSNLWRCGMCGKQAINKIDISRHIESNHVILPPLICGVCNQSFKTRRTLRTHELTVHENIQDPLVM